MATEIEARSPYLGPRPFERRHSVRFFGRDREGSELLSLVIAQRAILLYAQSGAGKTSLINAKLIPLLEGEGFEVLPLSRVRGRIPQEIPPEEVQNPYVLNTLISWAEAETDARSLLHTSLSDFLQERPHATDDMGLPSPRVVIFDQFEELFTFYPERWRDRRGFFQQVADALEGDSLLRVVFAIREDYVAQLDPYAPLMPRTLRNRYRLERLREGAALAAVKGPLKDTRRSFAEGVAEQLVGELLKVRVQTATEEEAAAVTGEFVEPVQLQVVCDSLWRDLPSDVTVITQSHLRAFGDVNQALSRFYERSIRGVERGTGVREKELRTWFERTLITPFGTRGTTYRGQEETGGIRNEAVDALEDAHLIRGEWRAGARWYELTHDRFIEPIRESNEAWRVKRRRALLTTLGIAAAVAVVVLALVFTAVWYTGQVRRRAAAAEFAATLEVAQVAAEKAMVVEETAVALGETATVEVLQAAAVKQTATTEVLRADIRATQAAQEAKATLEAQQQEAALALLPVEDLRPMLVDPAPSTRAAAAKALGQAAAARPRTADQAIPLLIERLIDDGEAAVRRAAAEALRLVARANPEAVVDVAGDLIVALQDDDAQVRIAVARILGQIGPFIRDQEISRQAIEALRSLQDDDMQSVRQAGEEALKSFLPIAIDTLVANWVNVDPDTGGITRIQIDRAGSDLSFHAYGKCHPTDCDWGVVSVPYTGVPVIVPYPKSFKSTTLTVTLESESDRLTVVSLDRYLDNSRQDRTDSYVFARSRLEPTPTPTPITAVTPGDKMFVVLFQDSEGLAIVDVTRGRVERTIAFQGINATYVSANPSRQEVYVSFANGDTFYVVDAQLGRIKGTIQQEVGWNASNSVVSPDGSIVYLASSGGPERNKENKILVIDTATVGLEKVIRLGPYEFPNGLGRLEISPDGQKLYTIDRTSREFVVVDAATGQVEIRQPTSSTRVLGISLDGDALYVLDGARVSKVKIGTWTELWGVNVKGPVTKVAVEANVVYVPDEGVIRVDDDSGRVLSTWDVGSPRAVAFSPDGASAYVTSTQDGDHSIHVFDTRSGKRVAKIPILQGRYPVDIVAMTVARKARTLTIAPVQLAPADGAVFDQYPRTTRLQWSPVPGAASYTVEIDCFHCCQASKWCTDVGRTFKLVPNITETAYTFGFVGAQPGRWRVWAVDAVGGEGPKSVWWGFRYTR